jgi:hypothetical protein
MGHLDASYRIVYFEPNPEDGDRVAIALLFTANNDTDVLYDPLFPKLKCLAPHVDSDIIRFQLDHMSGRLRDRSVDRETFVAQQAPQFTTSRQRKVTWPLSNEARMRLVRRFLSKEGSAYPAEVEAMEKAERVDPVQVQLRRILHDITPRVEAWQENAKPEWVIGEKVARIRPVAMALRTGNQTTIIDGVDLSIMKPRTAVARVGHVAYTFFQYGRLAQMDFSRHRLRKIGVVLNGIASPKPSYRDAHDFALQEFTQEADKAIDAGTPEGVAELKAEFLSG